MNEMMHTPAASPSLLLPQKGGLLSARGWIAVLAAVITVAVLVPVLNLWVPEGHVLHLSDFCRWAMACFSRSAAMRWACI
jgi:urea transport system permease protein